IDVINYYLKVARYLLPHFRNRPVTLKRYPNGIHGEIFYEKDAPGFTPSWVKTFPVPRREGGPDIRYVMINDRATLAWAASIDALELHPFLHKAPRIDRPTHVVFDLDPGEGADIRQCAEVGLRLRDLLKNLQLKAFPKISGSKGIQVYLPLNTGATYAATQSFAHAIAELLERQHPQKIVSEMPKNLRHGKVFIDWSQNADHKTTVGVYSLRAKRHRPYVSMPVHWEELEDGLANDKLDELYFTADVALARIKKAGDLFAPVLRLKQKLPAEFQSLGRDTSAGRKNAGARAGRGRRPRLQEYETKRHFDRTSEPAPAVVRRSAQGSRRRFVVQKHAASHLHYDLRLEMHDVLKSWAVPKGLPLVKEERHTGFETEDHPVEYLQFEGIIPRGEYGGGTVMVWDIGTYEIVSGNYWKGELSVFLKGKKLKGEWTLKRIESADDKKKWLITKAKQDAKVGKRVAEVSAISGKTMEDIAGKNAAVWRSNRGLDRSKRGTSNADRRTANGRGPQAPPAVIPGASPTTSAENQAGLNRWARGRTTQPARRLRSPKFVSPMKATAVSALPEGDQWIYEVKWDGYRALALKDGDSVRLMSLKEKNLTSDFPAVVSAVRTVNADVAVIDGEIVAVDAKGCPSFQMLQNRGKLGRGWQIVYYAFDILNLEGENLQLMPLMERKRKLREITAGSDVRYNADLTGNVGTVVDTIKAAGLEGIVAKQRDSLYRAGTRVTSWLKFKLSKSQEFVIGGYKPEVGSFQSILVGYYEGKKLMFAGKVRQGFNPASRARLLDSMRPMLTERCPFANLPTSKRSHFGEGITAEEMEILCWLQPRLVAQVSFTEWTNYGLLRHATFEGLRDDKKPREIVRETGM
ncbi:MAG TPA: non-homologous end-joining DNA ligase, partial [Chthoniobacterales bacterium]|nr:non-homologous end-joining DNA ligase [Chthoniobacterales bacterium]